jgi:glutamate-ammonia-ligase adenylyltransferase
VQLFSLFEANPQLIDLIVDIARPPRRLARYLGRNAQVLDAVIGGDFFADWPGAALPSRRDWPRRWRVQVDDYERKLDTARAGRRNGISASACITCAG